MALRDLKKMVSNSANALLGEDFDDVKAELLNVKKKIQETAEATGIDKGIKNAIDIGAVKINEGKEKLKDMMADAETGTNNDKPIVAEEKREDTHFSEVDSQLEQIKSLSELVEMGILSEEEFNQKKKEILGI